MFNGTLSLVQYFIFGLITSAERGSVLSVVLNLCILPGEQTFQLLNLLLQQAAYHQQRAH